MPYYCTESVQERERERVRERERGGGWEREKIKRRIKPATRRLIQFLLCASIVDAQSLFVVLGLDLLGNPCSSRLTLTKVLRIITFQFSTKREKGERKGGGGRKRERERQKLTK